MMLPKYSVIFNPVNPGFEDLQRALHNGLSVQFAVRVAGFSSVQIICIVPTNLQYTPSPRVSYCLIKGMGHVLGASQRKIEIEGMYHLTSRGAGGFDDM